MPNINNTFVLQQIFLGITMQQVNVRFYRDIIPTELNMHFYNVLCFISCVN